MTQQSAEPPVKATRGHPVEEGHRAKCTHRRDFPGQNHDAGRQTRPCKEAEGGRPERQKNGVQEALTLLLQFHQ